MGSSRFTAGIRVRLVLYSKDWLWLALVLGAVAPWLWSVAGQEVAALALAAGVLAVWVSWKRRILLTIDLRTNEMLINGPQAQLRFKADEVLRLVFKSGSLFVQTPSAEFLLRGWAMPLTAREECAIIEMLELAERH
jgi:hypothetical protein